MSDHNHQFDLNNQDLNQLIVLMQIGVIFGVLLYCIYHVCTHSAHASSSSDRLDVEASTTGRSSTGRLPNHLTKNQKNYEFDLSKQFSSSSSVFGKFRKTNSNLTSFESSKRDSLRLGTNSAPSRLHSALDSVRDLPLAETNEIFCLGDICAVPERPIEYNYLSGVKINDQERALCSL